MTSGSEGREDEHSSDDTTTSISDLKSRCEALLSELEAFRDHLRSLNRAQHSERVKSITSAVRADLKTLEKLELNPDDERLVHVLRSSNIPHFELVWETTRRSRAVVDFGRRFYWEERPRGGRVNGKASTGTGEAKGGVKKGGRASRSKYENSALVDIVAEDGAEWIKVSTVTQTRLIWELARQGWHPEDDLSEAEDDGDELDHDAANGGNDADDDSDDDISILRMAKDLVRASQHERVCYKHPRVHLILPRLQPPLQPPIAKILNRIRKLSPSITLSLGDSSNLSAPAPSLTQALETITPDPHLTLTPTLNIDCTILLALVSDLSHARAGGVERQAWFHRATVRQLEMEAEEALLPQTIYPALEGRELVCTVEAAKRAQEIVETIATPTERERMEVLLDDVMTVGQNETTAKANGQTKCSTLEKWQALSDYKTPPDLRLPIRVISADSATTYPTAIDASIAGSVSDQLSPLNQSVFLYGWRAGLATVTSNRTVTKQIDGIIVGELDLLERGSEAHAKGKGEKNGSVEEPMRDQEFVGPNMWLCGTSRSLIGKEKGRKQDSLEK